MCGRYQIESDWDDFPVFKIPDEFVANSDIRPTNLAPIVRANEDGSWFGELRSWGFLRSWPGPSGKWVKRQLFNAVGEELEVKRAFKQAYQSARCLVPMSAWYEWPVLDGKKTRVRIGMKERRMFAVAGLYETSKHPDHGTLIETFTVVTVPPNEILGAVHDRAPLVLRDEDYGDWLAGGVIAQSLITAHPHADAFFVERYEPPPPQAQLFGQ